MIQCGNSIMAATAAGGFRRYFGTGKSLSFVGPLGSVPTYVQKAWRLEFASGHGKKLIAKSIS
jgi:hypothetical protein